MPPISSEPPTLPRLLGRGGAGAVAGAGRRGGGREAGPVRLGVIGLGTRGTSLLRTLLELPGRRSSRSATPRPKHRLRGQGIVEKATGGRPEAVERLAQVLERDDVDAVAVALPCDLHAEVYRDAIRAGKHLYAEKPLALTLAECDRLIAEADKAPRGRRPRRVSSGGRTRATATGWRADPAGRARRADRGDGRLGQQQRPDERPRRLAGPPRAVGRLDGRAGGARLGRLPLARRRTARPGVRPGPARPVRRASSRGRDVTDHYSVQLEWADGFHVSFLQSWVAPADDRFTGSHAPGDGDGRGARLRLGGASPSATRPARARRSTPATRPIPGSPCRPSSTPSAPAGPCPRP